MSEPPLVVSRRCSPNHQQ